MDIQPWVAEHPVGAEPKPLLTIDEVAALLRLDRTEVTAGLAQGDLQATTAQGSALIDGDALWVRLDPESAGVPRSLLTAARLPGAAPSVPRWRTTVGGCPTVPSTSAQPPEISRGNCLPVSTTAGRTRGV